MKTTLCLLIAFMLILESTCMSTCSAFGVARTTSLSANSDTQVVTYNHAFREDPAFDMATGKYTCPTTGTFFFTFNALAAMDNNAQVRLMKDGKELAAAHTGYSTLSSNKGQDTFSHLGISLVTECAEGEQVYVVLPKIGSFLNKIMSNVDRKYTNFSGFRLA